MHSNNKSLLKNHRNLVPTTRWQALPNEGLSVLVTTVATPVTWHSSTWQVLSPHVLSKPTWKGQSYQALSAQKCWAIPRCTQRADGTGMSHNLFESRGDSEHLNHPKASKILPKHKACDRNLGSKPLPSSLWGAMTWAYCTFTMQELLERSHVKASCHTNCLKVDFITV